MKIGLITTTIHVPEFLALFPRYEWSDDYRFFVAGDHKTPPEAQAFCDSLGGNGVYLSVEHQKDLNYKSSELIGWFNDSRRNIALLEALRWGAEIIVSCDDDMVFSNPQTFFSGFTLLFSQPFNGLKLGKPGHWLDAGAFTQPPAKQRGLPVDVAFDATPGFAVNAKIGAAQGIILGVPDTDACTAITNTPHVHSATDILRNGFVADLGAHAVFNSQIVAFRRELAPCFAQFYNYQGRNTDIQASILMRRVMRDLELYTYYGPPMAYHARAKRPLLNDLRTEMNGLCTITEISRFLDQMAFPRGAYALDTCRHFYELFYNHLEPTREVGMAWCDDVESVL